MPIFTPGTLCGLSIPLFLTIDRRLWETVEERVTTLKILANSRILLPMQKETGTLNNSGAGIQGWLPYVY